MTFMNSSEILGAAARFHTPLYIFDEETIRQRCAELKNCLSYENHKIRYACKALTLQAVLKIVREEGLWIDASSVNEVHRAMQAGFSASEIYYTGEGANQEVYQFLVEQKVPVNCTSLDQIRLLAQAGGGRENLSCSIRINPGEGHGEMCKTNTGGPSSKHGIYIDQIASAQSLAAENGIKIIGVHSHIGSGTELDHWLRIKDITLGIASQFPNLEFVNLGGGLPVVYNSATDKRMPLEAWGQALSASMAQFSKDLAKNVRLYIEPGRYIVAESGILIADVQAVKHTPQYNFVIVNTGLNHNIRPALYGSYHPISFIPRNGRVNQEMRDYVVAGYLCESGDVFTVDKQGTLLPRGFPVIDVGDLMVMSHIGAYSHAMKNEYNSMNSPASLMRQKDGRLIIIERRGTLEDIMRRESEVYNE